MAEASSGPESGVCFNAVIADPLVRREGRWYTTGGVADILGKPVHIFDALLNDKAQAFAA